MPLKEWSWTSWSSVVKREGTGQGIVILFLLTVLGEEEPNLLLKGAGGDNIRFQLNLWESESRIRISKMKWGKKRRA
jgi:hypothetical protein